tara:strand:+ start:28 stop:996 length:969 start_codon:yes stop_codon:yes gene_type:complete
MKKKIILVGGDPNSINSEIIFKSWKKLNNKIKRETVLLANYELMKSQAKKLKLSVKMEKFNNFQKIKDSFNIKILDIPLKFKNPFSVPHKESRNYITQSFNLAHKLALSKYVKGIINCSVDKSLIRKKKNIGITELLASKCKIKDNSQVMLLYNKKLSVVPITTHIKIKEISKKINKTLIAKKINVLSKNYKRIFKFKPKMAVLGLNPHNAEYSRKSEEKLNIIPAIKLLRKQGIKIQGPLVADTVFIENYKKFNVIIGMYHDQVITPFKTLFKFDAVNITLGLKYFRISPDHGPAKDLIKKNKANYSSLMKCFEIIYNFSK